MKLALLSGDISNNYASAIILRLKQQGYTISTIIIKSPDPVKKARVAIAKSGLIKIARRTMTKFPLKKNAIGGGNINTYQREYFARLNCNPDITLKEVIRENNIRHIFVKNVNDEKSLAHLRSVKPDVVIYAGAGIVRKKLLAIPTVGVLNAHMGHLPLYKGMNVLEWSLFYNDPVGVTIHFIDGGIDTGDILLKKTMSVGSGDTIQKLRDKAVSLSVDALVEVIDCLEKGAIQSMKQDSNGKQYFVMHKRLKDIIDERLGQISN